MMDLERCAWANGHPLLLQYHDTEWGVPTHSRERLFEFLILESVQAGLSWLTVLKRRKAYSEALANFNPSIVAQYGDQEIDELLTFPGLIHHSKKIRSHVFNARHFLRIEEDWGSFDRYLWHYVHGHPEIHHHMSDEDVPSTSALAQAISRDLRARGFQFVGPIICYSYLQATGIVMDHISSCYRYEALSQSDLKG